MKLIHGKIHDYYDCVAKYGHSTEGNTFLRNPEIAIIQSQKRYTAERGWHWDTPNHPLTFMINDSINYHQNRYKFNNKKFATFETFKILFCGKLYKGLKIKIEHDNLVYTTNYCYNLDSVKEVFAINDTELPEKIINKYRWSTTEDFITVKSLSKYFTVTDYSEISIQNKLVIAILDEISHNGAHIELNGELAKYEFYKVFDPYSAYQTLSQYIDGQLAYPGNIIVDIPDEYKIVGKGFDPIYGFRTRPKE